MYYITNNYKYELYGDCVHLHMHRYIYQTHIVVKENKATFNSIWKDGFQIKEKNNNFTISDFYKAIFRIW